MSKIFITAFIALKCPYLVIQKKVSSFVTHSDIVKLPCF